MNLHIKMQNVSALSYDPDNVRQHDVANLQAIMKSLSEFGQRKPIVVSPAGVVIAGNGTLQAAKSLGWSEIATVEVPADWTPEQAKAFAIADNRTAELASWNQEKLALQLGELQEAGYELEDLGFTELPDLDFSETKADDSGNESAYTTAINIPQYQIVGEQPAISELFNNVKAEKFKSKIRAANLPLEVEDFLLAAANRHTVFNYRKIAEYYPHASSEIQALMEESALVIIDLEDAIRNAYTNFSEQLNLLREADNNAEK
jgi:hypothetical protein